MKSLIRYFFQGLFYTGPIVITAYVFYELFFLLDGLFPMDIPGLGIILIFIVVTAVGFLGSFIIRFPLFSFFDSTLERLPLVNLIYTAMKDVLKSFTGQRRGFKFPVLVKLYENSEIRRLGFVTNEGLNNIDGPESKLITVYVPHSFAISGQLFLVPKSYIKPIDESPSELMKYILAGGITEVGEEKLDPPAS